MEDLVVLIDATDRVRVIGELDIATAPELHRALARLDGRRVVVDLEGVNFVDSAGVHALMEARNRHAGVSFENPGPNVLRVLDIIGVADLVLGQLPTSGSKVASPVVPP